MNLEEAKEPDEQKPRTVPVVARRMIAHALGQRIDHKKNQSDLVSDSMKERVLTDELNTQDKNCEKSDLTKDSEESSRRNTNNSRTRNTSSSNAASLNKRNDQTPVDKQCCEDGKQGQSASKDYMKKEHLGAAKRMFAHALGVHSGKDGSVPRSRVGKNK